MSAVSVANSGFAGPWLEPSRAHRFAKEDLSRAEAYPSSQFKFVDGRTVDVQVASRDSCKDECTSEPRPAPEVQHAIVDERVYFNAHVWEGVTSEQAKADPDGTVLNGRWVFANKGDLANPDCRARYVACEINQFDDRSFFLPPHHISKQRGC